MSTATLTQPEHQHQKWLDVPAIKGDIAQKLGVLRKLNQEHNRLEEQFGSLDWCDPGKILVYRSGLRFRIKQSRKVILDEKDKIDRLYQLRALHRGRLHRTRWNNHDGRGTITTAGQEAWWLKVRTIELRDLVKEYAWPRVSS